LEKEPVKLFIDESIQNYAFESTQPEPELLQRLAAQTHAEMDMPQMLTGRLEGRFLKMLAQLVRPRLAVEVGTFTGYSALSMAEGMDDDAKLITCEINPKAQAVAQAAFDASPHGHKIELRMGPALTTIRGLSQPIDLAFIDADKEMYPTYYEEIVTRTRPGGVIVLDNMFYSGEALHPHDPSSHAIAALNRIIVRDPRVENVLLTIRDGVQVVRRKS
jgi:caffeoyl-CoA O-methyltransferase